MSNPLPCQSCAEKDKRIAELEEENADLQDIVDEVSAQRAQAKLKYAEFKAYIRRAVDEGSGA